MKEDIIIGMANCEKQVEQEAAYPIPVSLYNCYRTVRHEKRCIATPTNLYSIPACYITKTIREQGKGGINSDGQ